MSTKDISANIGWRDLKDDPDVRLYALSDNQVNIAQDRLETILQEWKGTPYYEGGQAKQMGTDCTRFVLGVLDEFYGFVRTPQTSMLLPPDGSMHSRESAIAAFHVILNAYTPYEYVTDGILQPADVLITGPIEGGPGHGMIVGTKQNEIWQCTASGVHKTGLPIGDADNAIYAIVRVGERHHWLTA